MQGVRRNAPWMLMWDDRILEYLDSDEIATPGTIAREAFRTDIMDNTVEERLQSLQYAGLCVCELEPLWELTNEGKMYLDGRIDARHQPTPTVEGVLRG